MAAGDSAGRLVWTLAGVVEAPVERVAEAAFADLPPEDPPYLVVDRERRRYVTQGHWWYRGVTSFEPHERGTLVTHRVYNIARTARWMVPFVLLQYRWNGVRAGLIEDLLRRLSDRLGCPAYQTGLAR